MLAAVRRRPGVRPVELSRELDANRGTTQYYLTMLERSGDVEALRAHRVTRYFAASENPADRPLIAMILRGRALEVVRAICVEPGVTQRDVSSVLRLSRGPLREYVDQLADAGLLEESPHGHTRRFFPKKNLKELLDRIDGEADSDHDQENGGKRPRRGPD